MEKISQIYGHYGIISILIKTEQDFNEYSGRTLNDEIQIDIEAEDMLKLLDDIKQECEIAIKQINESRVGKNNIS